jgi:arylsulfatase K
MISQNRDVNTGETKRSIDEIIIRFLAKCRSKEKVKEFFVLSATKINKHIRKPNFLKTKGTRMVTSSSPSKGGEIVDSRRPPLSRTNVIATATIMFLSVASTFASVSSSLSKQQRPNILFLIDESTDGRTYRPSFEAIDLINIKRLFAPTAGRRRGSRNTKPTTVQFDTHYVTAPVCAASRASIWSGKYPHKIPHLQASTGMKVEGAWNNFEGLPRNYTDKIHDVLERSAGYDVKISGKTDWVAGGHSLANRLSAWTMYASLPYNITDDQAGFYNEYGMCTGNGVITPKVIPHEGGYYAGDWMAVNDTTAWIRDRGREQAAAREKGEPTTPFFAYQGMNIVHPEYFTSSYWYNRVNHSAVTAPVWKKPHDLHPCDFQATMLKGCLPRNSSEAPSVYSLERRKHIRAIYYAMILEFDSMVGKYLDSLEAFDGVAENTIVIVTSDHGDMQMEHQQFYKQVPYDASSRVPLIIKVPAKEEKNEEEDAPTQEAPSRSSSVKSFVTQPTSHVDLFPTIMDFAGVPQSSRPEGLHGESLLPFLVPTTRATASVRNLRNATASTNVAQGEITVPRKRPFAVNQFHGCDIAMSWFSVIDENHFKYNVFGTGNEHVPQLFDLTADPDEITNLATTSGYEDTIRELDGLLRSVVDYEAVATDVARYTHASLGAWVNATSDWKTVVQNLRWSASFDIDAEASIRAMEAYLKGSPRVYECRSESEWPPPPPPSQDRTIAE